MKKWSNYIQSCFSGVPYLLQSLPGLHFYTLVYDSLFAMTFALHFLWTSKYYFTLISKIVCVRGEILFLGKFWLYRNLLYLILHCLIWQLNCNVSRTKLVIRKLTLQFSNCSSIVAEWTTDFFSAQLTGGTRKIEHCRKKKKIFTSIPSLSLLYCFSRRPSELE